MVSRASDSLIGGSRPGQAGGEHGLAGAGRTDHEDVVSTGRRDFEGPLGHLLSPHVGELGGLHRPRFAGAGVSNGSIAGAPSRWLPRLRQVGYGEQVLAARAKAASRALPVGRMRAHGPTRGPRPRTIPRPGSAAPCRPGTALRRLPLPPTAPREAAPMRRVCRARWADRSCPPSFGRSAGPRLMTTRPFGYWKSDRDESGPDPVLALPHRGGRQAHQGGVGQALRSGAPPRRRAERSSPSSARVRTRANAIPGERSGFGGRDPAGRPGLDRLDPFLQRLHPGLWASASVSRWASSSSRVTTSMRASAAPTASATLRRRSAPISPTGTASCTRRITSSTIRLGITILSPDRRMDGEHKRSPRERRQGAGAPPSRRNFGPVPCGRTTRADAVLSPDISPTLVPAAFATKFGKITGPAPEVT